jgi:replicative superfamily II helicase
MVDFGKLRASGKKAKSLDPIEIFRRLPKPAGINDLYTSQAQALEAWYSRRADRDIVIKLHTGGGKTLVGLLAAQSTLNELGEPVLYLVPTVQLVNQTISKAKEYSIPAVAYQTGAGVPLHDDFVSSSAVMIGTYKALFNGKSKFGIRGSAAPQKVGAIILDDAHAAFAVVRDSFTLSVSADKARVSYEKLASLFRSSFRDIDRLGTFDDIVCGHESGVVEVPYWAWHDQRDAVRAILASDIATYALIWPLLRDRLHLCHALISRYAFTITPCLPMMDALPTFADAPRRIYMSATIADDSDIVRTFGADPLLLEKPITSRSLAGVSERMVLMPDLMPFKFAVLPAIKKLLTWVSEKKCGSVVLVASDKAAEAWSDVATVAVGAEQVDPLIEQLQSRATNGPAVFANRYDGIDLPGDACRLLVMYGMPRGTSDYELFRATALYGGAAITRMLAQRIEQGIGRAARGSADYCIVILAGSDLAGWIARAGNFRFLTSATRAQIEIGSAISKEVQDLKDLSVTMLRSLQRDSEWIEYHADSLASLVVDNPPDISRLRQAAIERRAVDLWSDGYHDKAIAKIEQFLAVQQRTTLRREAGCIRLPLVSLTIGDMMIGHRTFSARRTRKTAI